MINFEDLEFIIKEPFLPSSSIVNITLLVNIISEDGDLNSLEDELFRILRSDEEEKDHAAFVKFKKEDMKDFIEKECLITRKELDMFSEYLEVEFSATIPYSRLRRLTKEDIKNIKKLDIKCIFGSFEII